MAIAVVIGGSGGIGHAIVGELSKTPGVETIHATFFNSPLSGSLGSISSFGTSANVHWSKLDVSDDKAVDAWMKKLGQFDWLINCVGYLHDANELRVVGPEKSIVKFDAGHFNKSMQLNCLPTLLLAKHAHLNLNQSTDPVFATISARVGSISDNHLGGWYSYRASKAALNMVIKTLSIEYQRIAPLIKVLALHPGTTDTSLSKPFQANVPREKLFSPEKTARLLVAQLAKAKQYPSGRFIAFDGSEIPW